MASAVTGSTEEWKWLLYPDDSETYEINNGSVYTLGEVDDSTFWKQFWPRNKNPPKILVGDPKKGIVVFGYKTRRDVNETAQGDIRTMLPELNTQELRRIRGNVVVLRKVGGVEHVNIRDTDGTHDTKESVEESKEETIPEELRATYGLPMEYLVRCEGSTDDNVDIVSLLEREGIMDGVKGSDNPGPLTFAYVRNNARSELYKILKDAELTRDAECSILEETIRQSHVYNIPRIWKNKVIKETYRTIYMKVWRNLLPEDHPESVGNPKLVEHLRSGLISARELGGMTPQKLWPEKWRDLEEARIMKQIATLEKSLMASTDLFECRQCGKRECTYREVQTRSADEPMTIFVLCLGCGNRWKE